MLSRYDAVLAALNAGVVIHAPDTSIVDANDRARELLGLQDLEGRLASDPLWTFLEADHSAMALERFPVMQVIASLQQVRGLTMIVQSPQGRETWFEVNAVPVIDLEGLLDQVVVTFIDVTDRRLAEGRLAEAEEESRLVLERSQVATCLVANDGRLTWVNPAMCQLFDRSEPELLSMTFLDVTHPDDLSLGSDLVTDLVAGRRSSFRLTKRYLSGRGRVIWGDLTVSAVPNPDGSLRHRIAQIIDVTREHILRESLMEAEQIAHLGGWRYDLATGHVTWSPALFALFGLEPADQAPDFVDQEGLFTRRELGAPAHGDRPDAGDGDRLRAGARDRSHGRLARMDGGARRGDHGMRPVRSSSCTASQWTSPTARPHADELRAMATHDALTGLANRTELLEEVTRAVIASRRSPRATAVLMMDLDRFKAVNDALGHAAGDELLVAAAARLNEVVRGGDLVARLGGDEFVVVMRDLGDPAEAVRAAGRLVDAFRAPFTLDGRELFATASVGVAVASATSEAGDLLREADTAMYAAKEAGRDRVSMFNEDLRTSIATRMTIEAELRHALGRGQLAVWYQPEVDLGSGAVVAVEALLRWLHPDGSVWTADRFVDLAEETGLILDIGDWVLRQACLQGAAWAQARPERPVTVRVNVSALQLAETGLIDALDDALGASGLDPTLMCVEITETALLRRTTTTAANLAAIHARGISVALDDFGTGYASLTYLSQYPIDVIKIDRSFIGQAAGPDDILVAGIIALAATLGITVTAEGVEHPAQASRLLQLGARPRRAGSIRQQFHPMRSRVSSASTTRIREPARAA